MIDIPLKDFDQAKLEQLLRNIPAAYVSEEQQGEVLRRSYFFPKEEAPLSIKCYADHFNGSPIPSLKVCALTTNITPVNDEIKFEYRNPDFPRQKIYSLERVRAKGADGRIRELFRYILDCSGDTCKFSFTK